VPAAPFKASGDGAPIAGELNICERDDSGRRDSLAECENSRNRGSQNAIKLRRCWAFMEGDLDAHNFAFQDQLRFQSLEMQQVWKRVETFLKRPRVGEHVTEPIPGGKMALLLVGCFARRQREKWHTASALEQGERQ
jgi:hypothetical protein